MTLEPMTPAHNLSRERLLAEAAKARAEIEALSPEQRALLDMQWAGLNRELALGRKIDEAARWSNQ